MKRRHLLGSAAALTITSGLGPSIARAQAFPDKPIRFVVPYAPGGATDTSARIAAEYLANKFGQQVLVENKPGGGTIIATEIVAKAKPDGYTLLLAAAPVATNTSFGLKLPYDPVKELAPVCSYVDMPLLLACNPKAPYKTMAEFLAWAKAQTSPIPYASAGNASMPHLWGEQLKIATGIKLDHVGYKGSADALKDVLGGHVMLFSDTLLPGGLAVKDGRLRGLVVAAAKRVPMLPDVPTVAEAGLPADLTGAVFFGVMATGGTPEPVIAKLNAAFKELLADPATSKKLVDLGFVLVGGSAADYGKRLAAETVKWRKVIQEAKITPPA
ncbi:MAG: tripartite tricarboxylate transporter substrate binding protein [Reyranella sp.]|uniref:Bug family tripartite tricarboxylate transporter substrate binding protein n=1 Tax=Reyranella sp. TaxID=1929291 RepID=UPI00121FF908|nr:tripartite tricarboxylate transporter substrate binding protein [Reyranella sp.]TAJ85017.1 MAG: tripartite tricarboxylate transporter substrate binding protein [Reyranella sp.]TBR27089.1 MAG: tripartite tricarboxylate transporter substrate binding protein [Reyranella sp.]